ncbi:MAG: hypothetical protein LBQ26_00115, partial [Holosporales bacterium]|nr:hypothetical protein [Holosporales bacterium]
MRRRYFVAVLLVSKMCCAVAQESQVIDLNAQSVEAQTKAATGFYVNDNFEEMQEAPPLSGPSLPFSGSYIALGAGGTRAFLNYVGKSGTGQADITVP